MTIKLTNVRKLIFIVTIISGFISAESALAQASAGSISGPLKSDTVGSPNHNFIYNTSAIELKKHGYVEEEFYIEGKANRYSSPEMQNADIVDSDHPYLSRFYVRRPPAKDFNGTVVIEWLNVTGGTDKDIDWWQSGHHFVRNGYAYIGVSAQRVGIESLKEWSPERYGKLDVTNGGAITNDALSYDIFSAVAKAVTRKDGKNSAQSVDILGGLKADKIIATGHSQSASRLAVYFNNVHPLEPLFDGAIIHGGGGKIRDDQNVKIFKLMAETDMARRAADPQPNTQYFRQWEVAGSSHVDVPFEVEYARARLLADGKPLDQAAPRAQDCDLPAYSHVPFRDVMNAAFEHMQVWVETGTAPPTAEPLALVRMLPQVEFARDERGNILGGIRLATHEVATATNTGMNSGGNRFCRLYGSHQAFSAEQLNQLYPSHKKYVDAVKAVVNQNLADGYILPFAAERTIREAEQSSIGR